MSHRRSHRSRGSRAVMALGVIIAMVSAPHLSETVRAQETTTPDATTVTDKPQASPSLATGAEAPTLLDKRRREILRALQARSRRPIDIVVDRESLSIVQMDLDLPTRARSPSASKKAALGFLNAYQVLLDPVVVPSDYVVSKADGCQSAATAVFQRVVDDIPVLGSKVTVQFSAQGALEAVTNAVASAPREIQPAVEDGRVYDQLRKIVPREQLEEILKKGEKILVPERTEGRAYLRRATLLAWREEPRDGPPVNKSVLVGVRGGLSQFHTTVSPVGMKKTLTVAEPTYHTDSQTGQTDSISYHAVGGASVMTLPLDRNPYETVYRFLQEHQSLFHTGAPRCQFRPRSLTESKLLPGVQFVRMEQRYVGLPVSGAELVFEIHDKSKVMTVSGHVLPDIDVSPLPQLGASTAMSAARQAVTNALRKYGQLQYSRSSRQAVASAKGAAELVVFPGPLVPGRKLSTRLAYKVNLDRFVYYIDAETGGELLSYSTWAQQSAPTINDGLALSEFLRRSYVTVQVGAVPTGARPLNTDVTPAFGSMSSVLGLYASLGWSGIDGRGRAPTANTNVAILTFTIPPGPGCPNAFFDQALTGEAYFCIGVASQPDVVGHEFTHGVIANSSGLAYVDEPGALNESYADLFGNLIFPDNVSPGATSAWLVGEPPTAGGPAIGMSTIRDMAVPGNFGHPGTMAGYVSRSLPGSGCNPMPFSCDSGFVHTNSGIVNRAHVLLAGNPGGSAPASPITGIGRAKLTVLAFLVMTTRLTPWSRLVDAAIATDDMARTLLMRGATTLPPALAPFVQNDADQVPLAFGMVGLSPSLSTGWAEPTMGFSGIDTFFGSGDTTASGCTISNVLAMLGTPSGQLVADMAPGTGEPPTVNFFSVWGIGFSPLPLPGVTLPPIGGMVKTHSISWFNIFGHKPSFYTTIAEALPPGAINCITPPGSIPVQRLSSAVVHAGGLGTKGNETTGNASSTMDPACTVTKVELELVDSAGNLIAGPAAAVSNSLIIGYVAGIAIWSGRGANLTGAIPAAPPDMSAGVHWWYDTGVEVRYRLRYYIDEPSGISCTSPTEF